MRRITVAEYEQGLLYVNGRYQGTLGPGRYWETSLLARRQITVFDLRWRVLNVTAQELVTQDKVNVRLSVGVQYRVTNAATAAHAAQSYLDLLYQDIQLPLRRLVAQREIDALLEDRGELDQALQEQVAGRAERYGVEVSLVAIKDVILPGELRTIMHRVVEAKKTAQAALISAREEVATARARQNVAAMIREHPEMLELLRLEAAKEIAKSPGKTFVFGGPFGFTGSNSPS